VVRARDASHTRIPAQEPKDRQIPPLFRVSLIPESLGNRGKTLTKEVEGEKRGSNNKIQACPVMQNETGPLRAKPEVAQLHPS
jgi:hypothetical protein